MTSSAQSIRILELVWQPPQEFRRSYGIPVVAICDLGTGNFRGLGFRSARETCLAAIGIQNSIHCEFSSICCLLMPSIAELVAIMKLRSSRRRRAVMLQVADWYSSTFLRKQPRHTSILTGEMWVKEVLNGNPARMQNTFRMSRDIFDNLIEDMKCFGLEPSRGIDCNEMLSIFLYFSGHKGRLIFSVRLIMTINTLKR